MRGSTSGTAFVSSITASGGYHLPRMQQGHHANGSAPARIKGAAASRNWRLRILPEAVRGSGSCTRGLAPHVGATTHGERLTGNVFARIAGEEHRQTGEVICLSKAA